MIKAMAGDGSLADSTSTSKNPGLHTAGYCAWWRQESTSAKAGWHHHTWPRTGAERALADVADASSPSSSSAIGCGRLCAVGDAAAGAATVLHSSPSAPGQHFFQAWQFQVGYLHTGGESLRKAC